MHPDTLARKVEGGDLSIDVMRLESGHRRYRLSDVELAKQGSLWSSELIEQCATQIQRVVSDMGISIPDRAVDEIYGSRHRLLGEIREYGLDTGVEEHIHDVIAREIVDAEVPMIGHGDRIGHMFSQRLQAAALERGWTITGEVEDQSIDWRTHPLPEGEQETGPTLLGPYTYRMRYGPDDELQLFQTGSRQKMGFITEPPRHRWQDSRVHLAIRQVARRLPKLSWRRRRPLILGGASYLSSLSEGKDGSNTRVVFSPTGGAIIVCGRRRSLPWDDWEGEIDEHQVELESDLHPLRVTLARELQEAGDCSRAVLLRCGAKYEFVSLMEGAEGLQLLTRYGEVGDPLPSVQELENSMPRLVKLP